MASVTALESSHHRDPGPEGTVQQKESEIGGAQLTVREEVDIMMGAQGRGLWVEGYAPIASISSTYMRCEHSYFRAQSGPENGTVYEIVNHFRLSK